MQNDKIYGLLREIAWQRNFDRAIAQSQWCKDKAFTSPFSAAAGNHYLYKIYKALDSGRFKFILDIGMGQTSRMFCQYVNYNKNAKHIIIEGDSDWIQFISGSLCLSNHTEIKELNYEMKKLNGIDVRVFENFKDELKGYKFDFISIDAPFGMDMQVYSRIDILDILPDCLEKEFIIMIDDIDRKGEQNTVDEIQHILNLNNIDFYYAEYSEYTSWAIITSYNYRYFATV